MISGGRVKGSGLEPDTNYTIRIQDTHVDDGDTLNARKTIPERKSR
ncbi:MAG: hypothetical protein J7J06_01635 [Methanosarcinales archaeon]|nr:hypothetical protein [Methanosarcinales archaeon]